MNKLTAQPPVTYPTPIQPAASTFPPVPARRLIVTVPEELDSGVARHQILNLAQATGMHIQLLGLCGDAAEELGFRRKLITMASLMQDGRRRVNVAVQPGANWLEAVKGAYQTGDVIVCFAEQRTGLLHKPLSQILAANLDATVYILSGLTPESSGRSRLSRAFAWLGFLGIIVCFGILQANIVQLQEGWLPNILLILSTVAEFWLIWVWNSGVR